MKTPSNGAGLSNYEVGFIGGLIHSNVLCKCHLYIIVKYLCYFGMVIPRWGVLLPLKQLNGIYYLLLG